MPRPSRRLGPYLQRRGAAYYFRYCIPPILVSAAGRKVVKLSLRTSYLRIARIRAASVLAGLQAIIPTLDLQRGVVMVVEDLREQLEDLLREMNENSSSSLEDFREQVACTNSPSLC